MHSTHRANMEPAHNPPSSMLVPTTPTPCCDQIESASHGSTTSYADTKPGEASGAIASITNDTTKIESASQSGATNDSGTKPGEAPETTASITIDTNKIEPASHSGATNDLSTKPGEAPEAAASITIDTTKLEIGTRLSVKFDDGLWYPGTIEKKLDLQCNYGILYDDGEREEVVIEQMPSDEFMIQRQSLFNIRAWRTVMSMTKHNSTVLREHEASRQQRRDSASDLPKNIRDLWWKVVWAQQAGFPAWPSLVVVCLVLAVCVCARARVLL